MRTSRCLAALLAGILLCMLPPASANEPVKPGTKIDSLTAGKTTYRDVVVRSANARTLMITHAGGMASIHLRDLSPEWQARFNYDPAAEAVAEKAAASAPPPPPAKRPAKIAAKHGSDVDQILEQFGQTASIQTEVNLRPKFIELGLGIRDQARRPSCAIYAIVSALEYQNARLCGQAENFSEDYLIWATQKSIQRTSGQALTADGATTDDADTGFSLTEVVNALRTYGIPLQSALPNNAELSMRALRDPPPEVIQQAREHLRVFVHQLPGRDSATRINNLVLALNGGIPVAIGIAWPNYRSVRTGYLSGQKPMQGAWHAVTVVGYHSKTGRIEDTYFIFKNSWGANWGQDGYGTVTYDYLNNYLNDAVLLEVQRD